MRLSPEERTDIIRRTKFYSGMICEEVNVLEHHMPIDHNKTLIYTHETKDLRIVVDLNA